MINNISHSKYTNALRKSAPLSTIDNMITKGQCKLSEKELITKITELARRDAAAGRNSLHDDNQIGSEFSNLHSDFISFASPDRERIIQKKLSCLTGNTASTHLKGFDLFRMLNRRKIHDPDVGPDYINFKDEMGREVASCSRYGGWIFPGTTAEYARSYAFDDLWKQALADAQEELEQEPSGDGDIIFEARA